MHVVSRLRHSARRMTIFLILLGLLLAASGVLGNHAAASGQQIITYRASAENFPNPERGFYIQRAPIWRNGERIPLTRSDLLRARSQGMSMVRTYYLLEPYRNQPLPQSVIDYLQADCATAREAGVKIVLRFAYNFGIGEPDAPLERVLQHIDQLTPVIRSNVDVIAFMEAGFIGAWGEWHNSTNNLIGASGVNTNTRTITNRLLAALPPERAVAVRTPRYKQQLTGDETPLTAQEAYRNTPKARLGAHNDCLLASRNDWGTYWPSDDESIARQKRFLQQDNLFLPQGGETCNDNEEAQPYIGCANALNELAMMRWSTINSGYHPGVLQRWRDEGCYDDIARRLGYRFRLIDAIIPRSATSGAPFSISVRMTNDGFARPYNPRGLELVLRHTVNGAVTRIPVGSGETRLFLPGPSETKMLTLTVQLPTRLATGDYEVLLNLPDPAPALNTRPEYSIRLANEGVWEPSTGYNRLLATVRVSNGVFLPVIVR
ncbi:MAG: DUF4832 domain-containing protein [Roseiflexus sp.]|nr:DUF4832 domain-containing protein [Roseiflexus sp.]MCS7290269.1 DUF4832 domain-containing protein [Roseiflexus sp.]MDW8146023.1 DUF4832 domain-containing protein [Roseiflexaceae bacterium]MDW8231315.1 DUF4832 domain-containing protein [Roseiflexaceae bacterium]